MQFTSEFIELFSTGMYLFLPILSIFILIITAIGQLVGKIEGWHKFDSLYWTLITALTVGYGDYRPSKKSSKSLSVVVAIAGIMFTGIIVAITVQAALMALKNHVGIQL